MWWPKDHPGRTCAKCGREVYWLWSDPVYPPPGTCMFDSPSPSLCDDFRAHCVNHLQIARISDRAPHPDFLKMLERAGVTLDQAIVWRDDFQAREDAKNRDFWAKLGVDIDAPHHSVG